MIINGKYVVTPVAPERMVQVINELVVKARAEKK
ncbi:hypothetical protein JOS77_07470 [Chromobacterium haemolyticum]|nr:hypothetical protein JOS77_07470 [Chromobacterium haemolyticum]